MRLERLRHQHKLPITCGCGKVMRLVHDRRGFKRKPIELSGTLLDVMTQAPLATVTITDLSLGGVGFAAHQYTIEVEALFTLTFDLDDDCQTLIQEEIVVRSVQDNQHVGVEFLYKENYNFDLDFYLAPWAVKL